MSINPFAVVAVLGHIIRRATLLKQISIVLKTYFKSNALKLQKNENEIWQSIKVKGLTFIDFGIGESTEKLAELGARVIVVDKDLEKIKRYNKNPRVDIVNCDINNLPFNRRIADIAVFYFTLHEVNPLLHKEVISNVHEIASKIMIVEPSPDGCPAYRKYSEIWANAMHSIGKFEDYQSPFYWKKLIEKCNFKITVLKRIKQNKRVSPDELEKIIQTTVEA